MSEKGRSGERRMAQIHNMSKYILSLVTGVKW
jgi:hypothetical protein